MKVFLKSYSSVAMSMAVAVSVLVSAHAHGQSATLADSNKDVLGFRADVGQMIASGRISDFTSKYEGYQSAQVVFNDDKVKLTVIKLASKCSSIEKCPTSALQTLEVLFLVARVERLGCYDSYHARALEPDSTANQPAIEEKIVIQRYATERCESIRKVPLAALFYRVTGLNAKTGELGSADAAANLLNLDIVQLEK